MSNRSILVDYDQNSGRFVIQSPFWALDLMRRIPNRKFEKRLNNAWTAPALRANVQYLQSQMPSQTVYTDAARVKIAEVMDQRAAPASPFPSMYKFKRDPKSHQLQALHAAYGRKAVALFMDMRTGKTKVVIDWSMAMWQEGRLERQLIIPLKTLRYNWEREFHEDANPDQFQIHMLDTSKKKDFKQFNEKIDGRLKVMLVGIESLSAGSAHAMCLEFLSGPKSMTTIDESDTIKNSKSIRTQRTFELRDKSEYRAILTGTPISEGPMDFFAQFEFLDPNIFGIGDFYSFRNRYAIMGGYEDKEIVAYQNMDELTEIVKPFVHQVRFKDVSDSPDHIFEIRTVELSEEQKKHYKRLKKDNTIRDQNNNIMLVVQNILEKMLRLQEICGGYWTERIPDGEVYDAKSQIMKPKFKYKSHRVEGVNPRVEAVIDILTREYKGEQGIVWCVHVAEIHEIAERLSEHGRVAKFYGDVSEIERRQIDEDFRAGKIDWLVANPTTGGRGFTFDAAYIMVNYTYTHHLIPRLQSLERATSIKKTRPVVIVDLMAEGTVDAATLEALRQKKDVGEYVRERIDKDKASIDSILGQW
jgi:SNF2 family DNA or RNA helicase